jgi:IclR family acetate operon transcriptional repressor
VTQRSYRIESVDRAISILEAFPDDRPLTQAEISRAVSLSEATTLRYLSTLAARGLIERLPSGRYCLGLPLFQLGERALGADARQAALPTMQRLAAEAGETVNFAVRNRERLVLIEAVESTRSIRRGASIGDDDWWHASALGKAILSELPESEAREIAKTTGWPQLTANSHPDWRKLRDDLVRVRERGYAIDDEEGEDGLRCIGAAVHSRQERARYALSVSGPASRLAEESLARLGEKVCEAAAEISARLGFTDRTGRGHSSSAA